MTESTPVTSVEDLPLGDDRTKGWSALRNTGEVANLSGTFVVSGADAVEFATKHPEIFSSEEAFDRLGSPLRLIPIAVDPPDHARYRRLLDRFFAPKQMAELDSTLRSQLVKLIESIRARGGTCDVVPELAVPYPSQVFLTLFGLPLDDRADLLRWKDAVLEATDPSSTEPSPEVLQHALELYAYLAEHVTQRRNTGGPDLLSQLVAVRDEGGMTDEEIIGLCFLFVLAGLDTVTSAIGFSFAKLGTDSVLRDRLHKNPTSIPAFVEEILRVEVPVPFAPRVTKEDVIVGDVQIPKGSSVLLALGAANRDPARTDRPDSFDLDRFASRHFAFGGGPHRCLGSNLARLELRLVLEEWHRLIPQYELAPGYEPQAIWPAATLGLLSVPLVIAR
jgi:cytochrome P450